MIIRYAYTGNIIMSSPGSFYTQMKDIKLKYDTHGMTLLTKDCSVVNMSRQNKFCET